MIDMSQAAECLVYVNATIKGLYMTGTIESVGRLCIDPTMGKQLVKLDILWGSKHYWDDADLLIDTLRRLPKL
jgi:hypothetical protein